MDFSRDDRETKLILAGFAAFPGVPSNPAERLVQGFDVAFVREAARLERVVLPVEWERSWAVLETAIRQIRPDAVLLVGAHARAVRFRIETLAFNERAMDRPDAVGRFADVAAIGAGPSHIAARLPLETLERDLRRSMVDFELSRDAGRYLCNETLFQLCLHGPLLGLRYYGFIHTPLTEECAAETQRRGERVDRDRIVTSAALRAMTATTLDCLARVVADDRSRASETVA